MKKICLGHYLPFFKNRHKLPLIMRMSFVLLFAISLRSIASVNAQTISLDVNNQSTREILTIIESQTSCRFFYNDQLACLNDKLSLKAENKPLNELLDTLFSDQIYSYKIFDNNMVVIAPREVIQQQRVTGIITDALTNEPIIGATIVIEGTSTGTVSDVEGKFSIDINTENAVLVISFIGYVKERVNYEGQNDISVQMVPEIKRLDEVVVIGYGTMEKKQVTSSVSTVSSDNLIEGIGGSSIANALQGKVSGLVISGTASPNSGNTFQLRGIASVNAGQDPLVVIDGMPGGDIRSIIQEDILSIDVLKDASAGAIYGTRAAGGVILITTKQGQEKSGKVKLTYTGELTLKQLRNKPEVLSAEEYLEHNRGTDYGSSIDWWDELLNDNPTSQKHVVNIDGGGKNAQIYATFMYNNNKGIAIEDERTDYAGRINANFNALDGWLDIKTHIDYRQASRNNNAPNFQQALRNNPTRSPYDSASVTGYNIWLNESLDYNVLADRKLYSYNGLDKWFKPDATIKLNILPIRGLSVQQTVAYELRQWEKQTYRSKYHRTELENNRTGTAYIGFSKDENISTEGYATYVNEFNKHFINTVVGYSYYEHNGESYNMTNYNFTNDKIEMWNIGEGSYLSDGDASMSSNKDITERLFAVFGRANYSYMDKYMITGSIRREGSSKFAKNNRWGTFWSVSGGWRISKEPFMESINVINDLKLRAGYGVTGNNSFNADYAATMYGSDTYWLLPDGNWAYTYGKTKNINNNLKWEEQHEWNAGIDFSLYDNRLYGKFDIYRRKVKGMIYDVQVSQPPYTEQTMYKNIGNMENKGWEFEIGGDIIQTNDWKYNTSMSFSNNKTKILTLWGNQTYYDYNSFPAPGSPGTAIRIQEGTTIGSFYIWKSAGFDDNGEFLLYNKNGEVIHASDKTAEDKQYCGNYIPKLIISWNHKLNYKNWDLAVNMRSWIDFDVYNTIDMYFGLPTTSSELNVLKTAYTKYSHITGEKQLCDFFLEDGTFLKIDAINLGYNLKFNRLSKFVNDARLYLTVNNVATFTKYNGIDPEVDITGLDGGIEWFSDLYPQTRTYTFGIQLTF